MKKIIFIIVSYFLLALPAFAVTQLADGSASNFADYIGKGKWTVVEIWSYHCPICKKTIHHLADFDAIAEDYNAQVIGVSMDGEENRDKAKQFVSNHDLEFTNLLATPVEIDKLIVNNVPNAHFIGTPTIMLFTPEGKSAGYVIGPVTTDELTTYFESQANTATEVKKTEKKPKVM